MSTGYSRSSIVPIIGGHASSGSLFTRPLVTCDLGPRKLVLMQPLEYRSSGIGIGESFFVPAGFVSDGASVPFPLRTFYPTHGKWLAPSVLHDYLYRFQPISRPDADNIFYEAMMAVKMRRTAAWCFYHAVDRFGGFAWRSNKRKMINDDDAGWVIDVNKPDWWKKFQSKPILAA